MSIDDASCRIKFEHLVNDLFICTRDRVFAGDVDGNLLSRTMEAGLVSGDEDGNLKIWDTRTTKTSLHIPNLCKDYISDIALNESKPHEILVSCGDGTLSVVDRRRNKMVAQSEDQEDELLSVAVMKNGKKVVVGTQEGNILIFSSGKWRDQSDRFPGHPDSVNTLVAINDDIALSGCSDGVIRLLGIQPNKLLGIIGHHDDFPVEKIKLSRDKSLLGSISHDNCVKLWDISYILRDEEDDEEGKASSSPSLGGAAKAPAGKEKSDAAASPREAKDARKKSKLKFGKKKATVKKMQRADFFSGI
eukprot:g2967.t1